MQAGKLRHRISITNSVVTGQDSFGADITTEKTVGNFWCLVEPLAGKEVLLIQEKWPKASYKITMRQPTVALTPIMQVHWKDRILDILDVGDTNTLRPETTLIAQDFVP